MTLRAARTYATDLVAVVSVADDGGSSGRLRELLDVPALGDLRKCLIALAQPGSLLADAMEFRYQDGELAGHALGNLVLAGLIDATGDLVAGIDEANRLLNSVGRVLPATDIAVALETQVGDRRAVGQVAVSKERAIEMVTLMPASPTTPTAVLEAIEAADQIIIGPGSLYTSVLAAAIAPAIVTALQACQGQRVFVCNLHPQSPESGGYSVEDHENALLRHGIALDVILWDSSGGIVKGEIKNPAWDLDLAAENKRVHDPVKLATALQSLLKSHRETKESM